MISNERLAAGIGQRAIHCQAADRVGPIEDQDLHLVFCRRFQDIAERADVRVESAADVLDVVDECRFLEGFPRRACGASIETL